MESDFRGLDEAFAYAATNAAEDVDAGLYLVYVHANGMNLGLPVFYHADVLHGAQLCAWAGFNSGSITAVGDTTKTRVLAEWAAETMHDSPNGKRQLFLHTLSTKADEEGARVTDYLSRVLRDIKDEAVRRGVFSEYVYMNYTSEYQDVVASYGSANKARLKSIAARYDPAQVFQKP
ncbi:hypothetical protein PG988_003081 [Apiospora saccharicola]